MSFIIILGSSLENSNEINVNVTNESNIDNINVTENISLENNSIVSEENNTNIAENISLNDSINITNSIEIFENNSNLTQEDTVTALDGIVSIQSTDITECGNLTSANTVYILQNNVNSTGTCFIITADNVTLDGNGYDITYGTSIAPASFAIYAYQYNNITIKNTGKINQGTFTGFNKYAIYLINSNYSTIYNNSNISTLSGTGHGIKLDSCSFSNITLNNITVSSSASAIRLSLPSNLNIISNNINSDSGHAVYLLDSGNNLSIVSNKIISAGNGIELTSPGILNITSNIFTMSGIGSNWVIYLYASTDLATIGFNNITAINQVLFPMVFLEYSNLNIFSNNITSSVNSAMGIYLSTSSNSNITSNNIFMTGTSTYGVYMDGSSSLNNITLNNINLPSGTRIGVGDNCVSNIFQNNWLNGSSNTNDISFFSTGSNGNWFIDQPAYHYSFSFASIINVKNSNYGEIKFLSGITGSGVSTNFSNDIQIGNNSVYVNSSKTGLNKSANVTLYNLPTDFLAPFIYYNGNNVCNSTTSPKCINFTSLNAGNVSFNVSSWDGNFSVLSDFMAPSINITYPINNLNYNVNVSTLNYTYSDLTSGNCWYSNNSGIWNSSQQSALFNFSNVVSVEGTNTWTIWCNDSGANINSSSVTFFKDTVVPQINFTSPTPINNSARKSEFITNISVIELNLRNITWNWNGTLTIFNSSGTNLTSANNISIISISNITSTDWIILINQSGLGYGLNYTYGVTVNDVALNSNSTETRAIRGSVAPTPISITQNPLITNYDNLDPGLNVTFITNLSDIDDNFDSAIFQWRNSSAGSEWNNITMENLTSKGIYTLLNTSITLPSYEGNITYRIWANDTTGEANASVNYTIQSFWDCTWNVTTGNPISRYTFGTVAGYSINKYIGNVTIQNTGDPEYANNNCSIIYKVSHNLGANRIYFDTTGNNSAYTVTAKNNRTIMINASYLDSIRVEESLDVVIQDVFSRSITAFLNATGILFTSQAGPFITHDIVSGYSSSIYLTPSNFSLTGSLYNPMGDNFIVNETNTAYNVSSYWVIPSEFTNVSGSTNLSYENISDRGYYFNDPNFSFVNLASMSPGIRTFSFYSLGYNISGDLIEDINNNTLFTNSINISFLCYLPFDGVCVTSCGYLQDSDCSAPVVNTNTGGGGSGGGGGGPIGGNQERSDAIFEIVNGQDSKFQLSIDNKWSSEKRNVTIKVSGINSDYISIDPSFIDVIGAYSSKNITVRITAPGYFTSGNYTLLFTINGQLVFNDTTKEKFSEVKRVTLNILDLSRGSVDEMVSDSLKLLDEMNQSGFSINEAEGLYEKILENYNSLNFKELENSYRELKLLRDSAFEAEKIIGELETGIKNSERSGVNVIESKKLLYLAQTIFKRGDYKLALERLKEAKLTYAIETKGEFNLFYEIKNHPVPYTISMFVLLLVSIGGTMGTRLLLYRRKLGMLAEEEQILLELMKVVQRECFEKNRMSMEEYEQAMGQYELRLGEVVQEKILTESKLAHIIRFEGNRRSLSDEKKRITDLIKGIQDLYLNKAKMETRVYENMLKTYSKRLAEIEEQLIFLDAKDALGEGSIIRRIFKLIKHRRNNMTSKKW